MAQNLSKLNTAAQQENVELKAELNQVSELVKALTVKNATLQGCTIQLGMTVDRLEKMLRMESHQSHVHKKAREVVLLTDAPLGWTPYSCHLRPLRWRIS